MIIAATALLGIVVICATYGALLYWKYCKKVEVFGKIPGPKTTPIFGNALDLKRESDEFFTQVLEFIKENKGIFRLWLGPVYPIVFTYKPEIAEAVLSSSKHLSKSGDYDFLHSWLGTGLLTSTGDKWKKRRKLITPTFHFKILNEFVHVFEEQAAILVSILKTKADGNTINIVPYVNRCALDIICATSMGKTVNAQGDNESVYIKAVTRVSELIQERQKSPWLWPSWFYQLTSSGRCYQKCLDVLHGFTDQVIDEKIAERSSSNHAMETEKQEDEADTFQKKRRLAFLDMLLESYDAGDIDRAGIREEVDTFMFEGHDTTAAGIFWSLHFIATHPSVQQKVQEDVDNFFETCPEELSVNDLKDLKYLERVIKESQRICPSVPMMSRTLSEDCAVGDNIIPKGTTVVVAPLGIHRNGEVWPSPLTFDPDRFLLENSERRHPYAYIPFSAGPRNCIGQRFALLEEKVVLANIIRHFSLESAQTFEELKPCGELIMRPKEGIFIKLKTRF